MTRSIRRYEIPDDGVVSGPIVEALRAGLVGVGAGTFWTVFVDCEIDDALPDVARQFHVVSVGEDVPVVMRPRTFTTFGGTQILDGDPEPTAAVLACAVDGVPGLFLYWLVAAPE